MYPNNNDRYLFFPFLVGAVAGGAAVGLTRPRPIVNAYPNQYYYPQGYNYPNMYNPYYYPYYR